MDGLLVQIALGFFGVILSVITVLLTWVATSMVKAGKAIVAIDITVENMKTAIDQMALDFRALAAHDTQIAVINSELLNLKADNALLFEKVREIERHDKPVVNRRQ